MGKHAHLFNHRRTYCLYVCSALLCVAIIVSIVAIAVVRTTLIVDNILDHVWLSLCLHDDAHKTCMCR